jgi:hypothetical protein
MTDDGLANDCKSSHYLWQGELKCHTKLTVSDITNLTQTKLHQQRFKKLTTAKLSFFLQVWLLVLLDIGSSSSSSVTISKGINGKVGDGWYSEVVWKSTFGDGEGVIADKSRELLLMDGICVGMVVEIYM